MSVADPHEHAARVAAFQETLAAAQLGGALLVHPPDVFYFTGTRQSGALWVPASGPALLLVRKSLSRARAESAIEVRPFPPSRELDSVLGRADAIGLTFDVTPIQSLEWYRQTLPGRTFRDVSLAVRQQRSVKSPAEVAKMRVAADRACVVFAEIPSFLRPGMREVDLAAEIEHRLRIAGNAGSPPLRARDQAVFLGLVASGDSGAAPGGFDGAVTGVGMTAAIPQGASARVTQRGEPVLVDYAPVFDGYLTDISRTFAFGALAPEHRRAFDVSLEIQDALVADLRPGMDPVELYRRACARAEEAGLADHFMGLPGEQARFVGHGIGLELDELPVLARMPQPPLVAGQVLALEPKFVFAGVGVFGIENTFVVTEAGGERLTRLPDALVFL